MEYIIDLEKIEGTNCYRVKSKAKDCNTVLFDLLFDAEGIKKILIPYEEEIEREIDWTKVPEDTKVFVSDDEKATWAKRHFKKYIPEKKHKFCTYPAGMTSWSTINDVTSWKYCKLAEEPKEEWYK